MTENKEKTSDQQERDDEQREVHIEPSEREGIRRMEPGRTPGKAEGKDDESATE